MRRISSKAMFWYKRIFPFGWFAILLIFVGVALFGSLRSGQAPQLMLLVVPVLMTVFGFVIMKKMVFDLVDEVIDEGDFLRIRNNSQEDRIALSDIINVGYVPYMNPPRVTLSLRRPSSFGTQVTFCAPVRFVPFATSPVIDELIQRIDAQRRISRRTRCALRPSRPWTTSDATFTEIAHFAMRNLQHCQ